jgi:cell division protein ZapA (FtsZ GTPase activity inhibitor)
MMRAMSSSLRPVKVQVAGQTLALRTDASSAYVRELAAVVNSRLAQVRERHHEDPGKKPVSTQALALLCALQLADELLQAGAKDRSLRREVREKTERILAHVALLEGPAARPKRRGRAAASP